MANNSPAMQIARKLYVLKSKQAKLRDEMRELSREAEQLEFDAEEAIESLNQAADAVSKLV